MRESLRWEAEPLLGYSPDGAPFDYTSGGSTDGTVAGSDWWVTSIEPTIFEAWKQACKETRFRLQAAMDPWSALASCLPNGVHLLVHKRCIVLARLKNQRMEGFKTWRRAAESTPEDTEWIDEVLGSTEWNALKDEVILWDLCDCLDPAAVAGTLSDRSGIAVRPTKLKGNGIDPWCHLLAAGATKLVKGNAPLPAARPKKDRQAALQTLETTFYTVMGVVLIAALVFWYLADSSTVQSLKAEISKIQHSLSRKQQANTPIKRLEERNSELAWEVQKLEWQEKEAAWHRRLPGDFVLLMNQIRMPEVTYRSVLGWADEEGFKIRLQGEADDPNTVMSLARNFKKAGLGPNDEPPFIDPKPDEDGSFTIELSWPKPYVQPSEVEVALSEKK
jgi:hypothetical protein